MQDIILVAAGQSEVVASGPQFGVPYALVGSDGSRAVFNEPSDPDYVGWLSNISGFDSPEVRESADDLIGDDGGVHGTFFYGRRPVVLEGYIESRPTNADRNIRMTRLQRASNAMRQDSTLRWAPEGGTEQILYVRRQQPLRITGGYLKQFQLALVSADPRIYGAEIKEQRFLPNVHDGTINNKGTMRTPPTITIYGPATAIEVHNHTTGEYIVLASGYALTGAQSLVIDVASRTVTREDGSNQFSQVQFASTAWWEAVPGLNTIAFHATGTTGATSMIVRWQDAWV
jgi:Phage tail protein